MKISELPEQIINEDIIYHLSNKSGESPLFLLLKQMNDRIERLEKELKLTKNEN